MGYPASKLTSPQIFTNKSVRAVGGNTVWLVSAEGDSSPKKYFLAAAFKVVHTSSSTYKHPDFKNWASGIGHIYGETIPLSGQPWFEEFKDAQLNFKNGLSLIEDAEVIDKFMKLSGYSSI